MNITDLRDKAPRIKHVDTKDVERLLHDREEQDVSLVSVREYEKFDKSHIPHFRNIPYGDSFGHRLLMGIPKSKAVLFSGSSRFDLTPHFAANRARKLGYQSVYVFDGGLRAWCAHGLSAAC